MTSDENIENEIVEKGLIAPRVTLSHLESIIMNEHVFVLGDALSALGHPVPDETKVYTICAIVLKNGFVVTGESACASPENFDRELGAKIARQKAKDQLWGFEGYLLKSKLACLV
jgi:hypothetical protein